MPTGGLRLMASCAFARHPRPDLSRRFQVRGANGTAIDDHERQWWGRCCHKRRLEYRLMVRRRDPRGSRRVAREFAELSSQC
jgi:hypothetical protein